MTLRAEILASVFVVQAEQKERTALFAGLCFVNFHEFSKHFHRARKNAGLRAGKHAKMKAKQFHPDSRWTPHSAGIGPAFFRRPVELIFWTIIQCVYPIQPVKLNRIIKID